MLMCVPVKTIMNGVKMTTLLTLEETAALLRKSPAAIRWMIHNRTAPKSALIGGRRLFRSADVQSFIEAAFELEAS